MVIYRPDSAIPMPVKAKVAVAGTVYWLLLQPFRAVPGLLGAFG
jgi:hypothetical protein